MGIAVEIIGKPVDLLVCHRGVTSLLELKGIDHRLTKDQIEFIARWPGKVDVANNLQEAIAAIIGKEVLT